MAIATQKTKLYYYDEGTSKVVTIGCPTSISGAGGGTNEQIETTCLSDESRTYIKGLNTPGEVSFDVNFDPSDDSHIDLKDLHSSGDKVHWAIGFSDGEDDPTWDNDDWKFTKRSNITFKGFITELSFDFSMNEVVTASVSIQISGDSKIEAKSS